MTSSDRPNPNELLADLPRRAQDFREELPTPAELAEETGGWRNLLRRVVRWAVLGFQASRAGDLAAGIAYYAMLAIVPTVLALLSITGFLLRTEEGYQRAVDVVMWIVPNELSSQGIGALPRLRDQSAAYALASVAGFLWIGSTFFAALGRAMNRVYRVPDRPLLHQRLRGFLSVLLFSVLFTVSVVAAILPTLVFEIDRNNLPLGLEQWPIFSGLYQLAGYAVAIIVSVLLFGMIFRIAPAAGQRIEDIVPGAVIIAIAFVIVAQVFPIYLRLISDWNLIGGTAGLLTLVLIWFYVLAHLFLFGAYLNATWQRHRRVSQERHTSEAGSTSDGLVRGQPGER